MALLKCTICGGELDLNTDMTVGVCQYCNSTITIPQRLDRIGNLYNRAVFLRQNNRFDEAVTAYEEILREDNQDAEAHWGIVLSKFGIEYVQDPHTGKRMPTCHRTRRESILTDADFREALKCADVASREVYEDAAGKINEIQKRILELSDKEPPYDIFICYKETDDNGNRTEDSVIAQDLYYTLEKSGYKVFFARKSLENKLGSEYEPIIFSALNSAKVMVVIGTKKEYINAVWVKNEWSRFRDLLQEEEKVIIPAYKNISPYDLPGELSVYQSLDMSKIGFLQDLLDGIGKIIKTIDSNRMMVAQLGAEQATKTFNVNLKALLKRAYFCIEDREWEKADVLLEQILNNDPENAEAYVGKVLLKYNVTDLEKLTTSDLDWDEEIYFKRALRFAEGELKQQIEDAVKVKNRKKRELEELKRLEQERQKRLKNIKEILFFRDKDIVEKRFDQVLHVECQVKLTRV